jgi:hypothetical protein
MLLKVRLLCPLQENHKLGILKCVNPKNCGSDIIVWREKYCNHCMNLYGLYFSYKEINFVKICKMKNPQEFKKYEIL